MEIGYAFIGDQATVTNADRSCKRLVIPSTVTYGGKTYNVNHIRKYALQGQTKIESLYLPPSIQSIGEKAFYGCTNLKKVVIEPNTVPAGFGTAFESMSDRMTYVGNHNYDDYKSQLGGTLNIYDYLSSMFEAEGVTYVPDPTTRTADAIDSTYKGVNVSVPTTVSYLSATLPVNKIKKNAFRNHTSMKQLFIGGGVSEIENGVFDGCTGLETTTFERGSVDLKMGTTLWGSYMFGDSPLKTVNKGRELSFTTSPFAQNTSIVTVNCSGSAKTIKSGEYTGCTSLTTLTTTDEMESIGSSAFKGLNLTDVTLGGNRLAIGANAFENCKSLAGLILESGVGNIGSYAFSGCDKIRSNISIGSQNELTIGSNAFDGCSAITNLTLGQGITSIGSYAFRNCKLVARFNLSEKITSIGLGAFQGCETITSMTVPSKIKTLNASTFAGCINLSTISLPGELTTIGSNAFEGTTSLKGIAIPSTVTSIGTSAFKGSGITNLSLPDGVTTLSANCLENTASLESVELNKVTAINAEAFKNSALKELTIHECVTSIGDGAFFGCSSLANLNIENATRMLTLGTNGDSKGLFVDCKLDNTYIGRPLSHGSISSEGYSPFYGNTKMKNVTLGGNYTSVPERMFGNCTALDTVIVGEGVLTFSQYSFAGSGVKTINIPSKISYIPAHCFENTTRLRSIELPETVKRIDTYAFYGSGLTSVDISGSIETITERSFGNTRSLQTVTLHEGTTTIEQYAFASSLLPKITIPRTVKTIGNGTFNGCTGLKNFTIADGASEIELGYNAASKGLFYDCPLENVYIGRNLKCSSSSAYGYSPFYRNTSLKNVEIGDIPSEVYIYMFQDCTSLETVAIGDGVTRISDYAFSGCANLATFNVGASIKTIGNEAFSDCKLMTTLKSYASEPPICGSNALTDINIFSCTLYIPYGSTGAYSSADQWRNFFSIQEFDAGIKVSYIELSQSTATLKVGECLTLTATAYPEQAMLRTVSWTSSNEDVAIVDASGRITTLRDGITEITATANDGSGVKAVCRVTVVNDGEPGTYRFEIPSVDMVVRSVVMVPVTLVNESDVIAFQCDLVLPTGVSVATNASGRYYAELSDRAADHSISINEIDGIIRFAALSMSNSKFKGNEGVLFYIPLVASGDPRECGMTLRNILLSKKGNVEEELTPVSATLNIMPAYKMGDVNGDGSITVIDATMTLSYVLGIHPVGFQSQAADLDGNGRVSINDITSIISIILGQSGIQAAPAKAAQLQRGGIEALKITSAPGSSAATIAIDGSSRYVAMQMDIEMPEGAAVKDLRLSGDNALTHNLFAERIDATTVRVVAISMTNVPFADDEVLTVELDLGSSVADAEVTVRGCRAVMADGSLFTEMSLNDASEIIDPETSGIASATADELTIAVEGRALKVTSSTDTSVTVCNITGMVRRYEVAAGTTRIELATPGVYIVNNKKFIIK